MAAKKAETRENIEINADGETIRGWLFRPPGSAKKTPCIVLGNGFSAVKEMGLADFAERFAAAGMAAIAFDFRNLGESDGSPRQELDPAKQIEDLRHAITYATMLPKIDPDRIGLWGTSYSGGHSLVIGGTDRRIKCVVVQMPTISGHWSGLRRLPMDMIPAVTAALAEDRVRRMRGEGSTMRPIIGELDEHPIYATGDVREFFDKYAVNIPTWGNEVTLRTLEYARAYEPGAYIEFISPTPFLMIVGQRDTLTCYDLQLEAYNRALEPKKLVLLKGGHFTCYDDEFEAACSAAVDWFTTHLFA
jgi:fermentation-respiration switch protein FrsA (DUF1100 family)